MTHNTFDDILGLEEQFYDDGYKQGMSDGVTAGRIEGRTFGLEKGFEKYVESGRLYGKSIVWANRMPEAQKITTTITHASQQALPRKLPSLSNNVRLSKHVKTLHALAEAESLSTENTEEAVSDFDDRCRRAQAKAKVIERLVGEVHGSSGNQRVSGGDSSIEAATVHSSKY